MLQYLKAEGGNIAKTARAFGVQKPVVYNILRKYAQGDLADRSKAPHRQPRKSFSAVEYKVIAAKNKTHLGPERLSRWLAKYEEMAVAPGNIRHILRRNREKLQFAVKGRRPAREKRELIDWYSAKPFEVVQVDLTQIRDLKALSREQNLHLDQYQVPNYQWSALDVNSRFT